MKYFTALMTAGLWATGCAPQQDMSTALTLPNQNAACAFLKIEGAVLQDKIWQARARCDVITGHNIMLASHPGPMDSLNPDFMGVADKALADTWSLTQSIKNPSDYDYVLKFYSAQFRDGHFQIYGTESLWNTPEPEVGEPKTSGPKWAGIVMGWRDEIFTAVHVQENTGVTIGDQLLSCDGRTAKDMMLTNIFGYTPRDPGNPASWANEARHLLRDNGNPFIKRPAACMFLGKNGEYEARLTWQIYPQDIRWSLEQKSVYGPIPKTSITQIKDGIWWINLPEFNPQSDAAAKPINALISEIENNRDGLRTAKAIVFDTRGNNGGNSSWGVKVLKALYGEEYLDMRLYSPDVKTQYRLNPTLIDHMKMIRQNYGVDQNNKDVITWVDDMLPNMEAALKQGKVFYTRENDDNEMPPPKSVNPVKAEVFLFTHGWCASACLDFADYVYAVEGSRHIGYYTGSDSAYMEARNEKLPTEFSQIVVPLKVYRNRQRGNGEFYTPEKIFNDYGWSDESVHDWFLQDVFGQ